MSVVKQCDNCKTIGERVNCVWLVVRVPGGMHKGMFGEQVDFNDFDYCSWKCVVEGASLRAHEHDLAQPEATDGAA